MLSVYNTSFGEFMFDIFTDLATWLVVDVFELSKETKLGDALHFFIEDTTKIFFLLLVMIYAIALIRGGYSYIHEK